MKDQYFGDINDYRKYGLLRAIIRASGFGILVAWMLTPDDGSTDGKFISYLEHPSKWSFHDPVLFEKIRALLAPGLKRQVSMVESTGLLPIHSRKSAQFHSAHGGGFEECCAGLTCRGLFNAPLGFSPGLAARAPMLSCGNRKFCARKVGSANSALGAHPRPVPDGWNRHHGVTPHHYDWKRPAPPGPARGAV